MKRLILLFVASLATLPLFAQDIIVLKNGTIVRSKIMEVSSSEIKYKRHSNPDGPLFTLKATEIVSINYENGEVDHYDQVVEPTPQVASAPKGTPDEPLFVEVEAAENNQALLDRYNNSQVKILKEKAPANKVMDDFYTYKFGVTSGSVLSSKEIEVTFENNSTHIRGLMYEYHRDIKIANKTGETIYIDLAKSFRINLDGSSHIYYDGSKQTSVTSAGSSGMSLYLGAGVSVGSSGTNATTTTYTNERILAIPPHSHAYFSTYKRIGKEEVSAGEPRQVVYFMPWEVKRWGIYNFTETDSPGHFKYTITYSKDADFTTYSQLKFDLYIQQVLGLYNPWSGFGEMDFDPLTCILGWAVKRIY